MNTELRQAIDDLINRFYVADMIYDVRERIDRSQLEEDQSSWDHPDVIRFSECVETLRKAIDG